jgi:hypothetical protein
MPFIYFDPVSKSTAPMDGSGLHFETIQGPNSIKVPRDKTLEVERSVLGLTRLHSLTSAMANRK